MKALSYAILAILLASSHIRAAELGGWNKVKWGMKPRDIIDAYPEARANPQPDTFRLAGRNLRSTIVLERFQLAGDVYKVFFLMDAQHTLGGVVLALDGEYNLTTTAETLEKLLIQKYGPPSDAKDKPAGGRSLTWSMQSVTIHLDNIVEPSIRFFTVRLRYLRPNTESLDKL